MAVFLFLSFVEHRTGDRTVSPVSPILRPTVFVKLGVVHTFNPSTWVAEPGESLKFKASLVYRASSNTGSKATEKPCLEKTNKTRNHEGL